MTLAIVSLAIILIGFMLALCKASSRGRDDTEQEEILSRKKNDHEENYNKSNR